MKKRFLILQKKLFVLFVIFIFIFLPIAPTLTGIQSVSAKNNFNNTPNFNQWTRTAGNNAVATPGSTTVTPGNTVVTPGATNQTQWTTQPDFNQGTNVNTSNTTSPGDVVLNSGTSTANVIDTTVADFNAGNTNPNNNQITSTVVSDPGDVGLSIATPSATTIFTSTPCGSECPTGVNFGAIDPAHNLVYAGARQGLFTVDTKGTLDPTDDTQYPALHNLQLPHPLVAIAADQVSSTFVDTANHLLYIGTSNGVSVVDTHGTINTADDTLIASYNNTTTPTLPNPNVHFITLDILTHLLYVGTDLGLSVIDTKGTVNPIDDTLVFTYNTTTTPALNSDVVSKVTLDNTTNLLYVESGSNITVIDTKGTITPTDDTIPTHALHTPFMGQSGPVLAFDTVHNLLYTSTLEGLTVINTHGNTDPTDDSVVTTYTASMIDSPTGIISVTLDIPNNLIYVSTIGTTGIHGHQGGLSVINTQGTVDPSDDTKLTTYNSWQNGMLTTNGSYMSAIDSVNHIVYTIDGSSVDSIDTKGTTTTVDDVASRLPVAYASGSIRSITLDPAHNIYYVSDVSTGLTAYDTHGTATLADDTLVKNYGVGTTPAIASTNVNGSVVDSNNNLLYVNTDKGLSVIDTKGTIDPTDDTFVTTYNTTSPVTLSSNYVQSTFIDTLHHLLYVSTLNDISTTDTGSLSIIDTKGTIDPTDDVLVGKYDMTSTPALGSNDVRKIELDPAHNMLYVLNGTTLSTINTQGTLTQSDDVSTVSYIPSRIDTLQGVIHITLDTVNHLQYLAMHDGRVAVIDTHNTIDTLDDTLVAVYNDLGLLVNHGAYYPNIINDITLDQAHNLVYISTAGGVTVIDTHGTVDGSDDTVLTTYNTGSPINTGNDYIHNVTLDTLNNLIYVNADYQLSVIDTKGTTDPTDDTLVGMYSPYGTPSVPSGGNFTLDQANGLIYFNTSNGLEVIDTHNTSKNLSDDTILTTYDGLHYLTPTNIQHIDLDIANNTMYLSTSDGLIVLNTYGNGNPSDDTITAVYNFSSSPSISTNTVSTSTFDSTKHLLYIGTNGYGVSVIDTKGTIDPTDDTLVTTYTIASTPFIASDTINNITLDATHNLLYINTDNGLSVIDTKGTIDPTDDTLLITYDTGSIAPIANNNTANTVIDTNNNFLYISTYSGLSVIDTKGTIDPTDDTLVTTYDSVSTPSIVSNWVYSVSLNPSVSNLIYISTDSGLSVIDTKGTVATADDTVVTYNSSSSPALPSDSIHNTFFDPATPSEIYTTVSGDWSGYGIVVINTANGTFNPSGTYFSSVRPIATTPTNALAFNATQAAGQTTSLAYRTGITSHNWVDNFDDNSTSEFSMNPYNWGDYFHVATENNGTMKLSDPLPFNNGLDSGVDTWINTSQTFAAGSTITARIRINSNTRVAQTGNDWLFTGDWSSNKNLGFLPNNTWETVTLTPSYTFSTVGFEIAYQTGTWDTTHDSLEIDSITIAPSPNLSETILSTAFAGGGVAQGWHADDASWAYTLPFDFTFYGVTYAAGQTIKISSNGIICLDNTANCDNIYWNNIASGYVGSGPIIAPLSANLRTDVNSSDDIYITTDPNFITFRWQTIEFYTGNPIDFEATLFKNNTVEFNYQNKPVFGWQLSPHIGIDNGDGINFAASTYNSFAWYLNNGPSLISSFWSVPTPPDFSNWNSWSTPCTTSPCPINPTDLASQTNIQYKLALTTNNSSSTPLVHDVSYLANYDNSGTYTSQNITFPAGNKLTSFVADITVPTNTSLTFEYSIDGGTTWTSLPNNYTFPSDFIATQFQWRATLTSSSVLALPTIHGVVLSSTLPDTTSVTPDVITTTPPVNPPDSVSKVTLDQKKLKTGKDINYTETCTPLLEGKYTNAANGEVILYQLRDTGSKDQIKTDSIDNKGVFSLRIPTIDKIQTYFLRLLDSNGDESALSKQFIISCEQPMPPYTAPLEESSEIMLPHIRPEGPPTTTIISQDDSSTPVIASISPAEITNAHPILAALLSIGGLLAGTALFGGLLAFFPLFSAIPSALQGGFFSVLPITGFFTSRKGRKNWGTVFDAQTKQAIPNVRLSLVNERGSVLDTVNTDQYGRYGLLTTPGVYTITVNKGDYKLLTTQTTDSVYGNIYHGEKMTINSMGEIVALNIALDPGTVNWKAFARSMTTRSAAVMRAVIIDLSAILYGVGGIFTIGMAYMFKDTLNIIFAILYILFFGCFIYQSMIRGKSFGTLKDKQTTTPIAFAQVALHTITDPHRAAFAVTDPIGRYYLLADNGRYRVKVGGQFENRVFNEEVPVQVNDGTLKTDFVV